MCCFCVRGRRTPRSTRTATLVPYTTSFRSAFDRVRAMLAAGRDGLWLVTRGAQTEAAAMDAADGACIAGLGKVAALEHSELRCRRIDLDPAAADRSEEHTSELQSLMRISYAVFCLKKKKS